MGKSLLALNLADRLSQHGHDVLFMDLDPNGHITESLGYHDVFEDPTHDLTNIVIHEYGEFDEYIFPTGWEWDFVPASVKLSTLESELSDNSITLLKKNFTQPLLNDGKYDYIIMDGGGEWSHIAKAAYGAAGRTIIPIPPGDMNRAGFKRTYKRVVDKMPEQMDFKILAIVPNMISEYLKHDKADRRLIESLNHSEQFSRYLLICAHSVGGLGCDRCRGNGSPETRAPKEFHTRKRLRGREHAVRSVSRKAGFGESERPEDTQSSR